MEKIGSGRTLEHVIAKARKAVEENHAKQMKKLGLKNEDELRAHYDAERSARIKRDALARSGIKIPPPAVNLICDGKLNPTHALRAVQAWFAKKDPRFIILSGGTGTGKTVAAGWAIAEWDVGRVVRSEDLGPSSNPYSNELRIGMQHVPTDGSLFVLDDLGDETIDERWKKAFASLIETRLARENGLTIFTTNITKDELKDRYKPRIVARIRAEALWFSVGADSLRQERF